MMSTLTSGQPVLVFLVALCVFHITDTHIPPIRQRDIPVSSRSSAVTTVRDLLTAQQERDIRRRWAAQGLEPSRLESMFRRNGRDFISQHNQRGTAPSPRLDRPNRGRDRSRTGRDRSRDPTRRGGFIDRQDGHGHEGHDHGNIGRNTDRTSRNRITPRRERQNRRDRRPNGVGRGRQNRNGHEGHDHGSIGENIDRNGRNGISRRERRNRGDRRPNGIGRDRQNRGGRGDRRIPPELLGLGPNAGLGERTAEAELQRLLRNGRNRGRNGRLDRTQIDPLGRPIDMIGVLPGGMGTRSRNLNGRRIDGHDHGHNEHGHVGESRHGQSGLGGIQLGSRQRGGITRLDGTRERVGLNRIRARNNGAHVVPPPQRRRRRRRNGLARVLRTVVGTLLG